MAFGRDRTDGSDGADMVLPQGPLDWLAPARLLCTDRFGGVSRGSYGANNLAFHVDDEPKSVSLNRTQLLDNKGIKSIQWLEQVHGARVIAVSGTDRADGERNEPQADAMYTTERGVGLAILTADCLPVVVADVAGEVVGAAHAGWRGFCAGVLGQLIANLPVPAARLRAFIGPAIGPSAFEVGSEVVAALADYGIEPASVASPVSADGVSDARTQKYLVNLARAAEIDLRRLGVTSVVGGGWCTASDDRFYSWRRETHRARAAGEVAATGRQATLVWLPEPGH